jgi:hypothetical protein
MLARMLVVTAVLISGIATARALTSRPNPASRLSGAIVMEGHHHHPYHPNNDDGSGRGKDDRLSMPEPATLALLAAGLASAVGIARFSKAK